MLNFINNLSIRKKLALLLIVPFSSLFFFAGLHLYTQTNEYQKSISSLETLELTSLIAQLVHSLQKERGMTAGYLGGGRVQFSTSLINQRNLTNTLFSQLSKKLAPLHADPLLSDKINDWLAFANQRKQLNLVIQKGDTPDIELLSFNHYTKGLYLLLSLSDILQSRLTNQSIAQKFQSLHNVMYLQEYAGQERALLNRVFSSNSVSTAELTKINITITLQESMLNNINNASDIRIKSLINAELSSLDMKEFVALRTAAINKFSRLEYLNTLYSLIGYGGLIHDFKNYLVRGEIQYLERFYTAYNKTQTLLTRFRALPGLGLAGQKHLDSIERTLAQYTHQIERIRRMHTDGKSITEIDQAVKIDDSKALYAIQKLKLAITNQDATHWWRLATQRIDAIFAMEQLILNEMHTLAASNYQESLRTLQSYILLMIFTLFASIFFTYILSRRVVNDVVRMSQQVKKMMLTKDYTTKLPTVYHDEISVLANSFNELLHEKNHYEAQIWKQANHDQLTGLPNRHFYMTLLKSAIESAKRHKNHVSVLFLDLDNFKQVNDRFGHDAGDELLQLASQRIRLHLRETDTLARQGGDEFILILADHDISFDSESIVKCIINDLNQPFLLKDNNEVVISSSIGISVFSQDGDELEELIRNADTAMYASKQSGKNTYKYYSAAMNEVIENRIRVESDLNKAIEEKQFELYYQPVLDTHTHRIIGVEALIRWVHPEKGMIYPDDFITIAEETNQIIEIGAWVIEEAIQSMAAFNAQYNCQIQLSINISSKQCLDHFEFVLPLIQSVSKRCHFNLSLLHIEITESILMDSSDQMIKAMKAVSATGIQFHLDDFGTGYSSLSYLKKFPMDLIKIDRSFIMELPQRQEDIQLIQAIISMAQGLKLEVIAEGVETEEQLTLIKNMGCHLIQGYYLTPPISFEKCAILIKNTNNLTALS